MEWDQEMVLQLINEYKKKEILWNPRDSAYYNKIKKEDAWRKLAQKFGKNSEKVKKKIESLKGSYRREKVRTKTKNRKQGTGKGRYEIYKSRWFAYESLQFLDDKDEPRKTLSNVQTVSDEETDNETLNESLGEENELKRSLINEESINSQTTEQLTDETQNKQFKFSKKRYMKQKKTDEDPIITALGYLRQTTAQQQKDQCSLFGDYIADKLRSFDNRLRAIAQNRISNVLFELEMNIYQNPAIHTTHTSMQSPFPVEVIEIQQ